MFMVFIHSLDSPGSTTFILSLVYCMMFVAHIILGKCLGEEEEEAKKKED